MAMLALFAALVYLFIFVRRRRARKSSGVIMVSALEHFFVDFPTGKIRDKCCRLGPRSIFLGLLYRMRTGVRPVIILYEAPDPAHLTYLQGILGHNMPEVLWPEEIPDGPLDLVGAILADEALLTRLRQFKGYRIEGLMNHSRLSALEHGLSIRTSRRMRLVRWLTVHVFNNKAWFQWLTLWRSAPNSKICRGTLSIKEAAMRLLGEGQSVMLRLDRAAGGLGNNRIDTIEALDAFLARIADDDTMLAWECQRVLVEPVLEISQDLSVMISVGTWGPRVLSYVLRAIEGKTTSAGSTLPAPDLTTSQRRRMWWAAHAYGWIIWLFGFRGEADLDASILADGRFAWFESNGRWLATSIQYGVHLVLMQEKGVVHGNDCQKVRNDLTSQQFKQFLTEKGLLWELGMTSGVILTVPPYDGALSYVAVAQSHEQLLKIRQEINTWANA